MIRRLALLAATAFAAVTTAAPVTAQDHSMHDMPGMTMPPPAPAAKPDDAPMPTMDHGQMDHSMHDMPAMGDDRSGTDLPPGNAPAPPAPLPHAADAIWGAAAMAPARETMMREEGGAQSFAQIMVNLAEMQARKGPNIYRWEGAGWFGGDVDRFVLKSEGEGGDKVEAAEVQALYSRAIDPYFNLQAGIRHDIRPSPNRSFATVGIEGLAPYWFDVGAAAFLSTKGELLGRIEASYDQRITQRLILQPRAEINLSAQRIRAIALGAGVTQAELGLRLRYEISRAFAPYVGASWDRKLGGTARLARAAGEDPGGASFVAGIRAWF